MNLFRRYSPFQKQLVQVGTYVYIYIYIVCVLLESVYNQLVKHIWDPR